MRILNSQYIWARISGMEVNPTRFKELRAARGLSIRKLAEEAGVSTETIYSLEHGRREFIWPKTVATPIHSDVPHLCGSSLQPSTIGTIHSGVLASTSATVYDFAPFFVCNAAASVCVCLLTSGEVRKSRLQ